MDTLLFPDHLLLSACNGPAFFWRLIIWRRNGKVISSCFIFCKSERILLAFYLRKFAVPLGTLFYLLWSNSPPSWWVLCRWLHLHGMHWYTLVDCWLKELTAGGEINSICLKTRKLQFSTTLSCKCNLEAEISTTFSSLCGTQGWGISSTSIFFLFQWCTWGDFFFMLE